MTALGRVLDDARRGEGGVVDVVGEPGIGKSRLVAEMYVTGPPTFASCTSTARSTRRPRRTSRSGTLLLQALELDDADSEETAARLAAATEAAAPELVPWLPLIGVVLGLELPPTVQTAELGDAVRRVRLERTVSALLVRLLARPRAADRGGRPLDGRGVRRRPAPGGSARSATRGGCCA